MLRTAVPSANPEDIDGYFRLAFMVRLLLGLSAMPRLAGKDRRSCCGSRALPHPRLFARLVKPRRNLGQVCDPRWMISRLNDQLNASQPPNQSCADDTTQNSQLHWPSPIILCLYGYPITTTRLIARIPIRFSNIRGFLLAMEPVFISDTQNLSHQWPLQNRLRFVSRCTLKYQ
jgi:hypothetical protein